MGIFDYFLKLMQDKNSAEASTLQDMRRHQEADRAFKRRQADFDSHLKKSKKELRAAASRLKLPARQQPRLSSIQIHDILGFQPQSHRRKKRN